MRILQINVERGWRGGERQTLLCMTELRRLGQDVALLARAGSDLAIRAKEAGFLVIEVAGPLHAARWLALNGKAWDVLHAQTANMVTWLALLKRRLRAAIVFTRRTAFPVPLKRASRTRWKWQRVDALIAISEAAAAEPRRMGLECDVIPSAITRRPLNEVHLREFQARHHLEGKRILATVAALTREKDPCTLIRAAHLLRQRRDDFVLLHFGADGDVGDEARALVEELQLSEQYCFVGFESAVEDLYRLMDGFVLTSRHEALGTSVLDAFLYGVPVVSTDTGGLSELLADGRGILCPVESPEDIARAMDTVLDDAALRASMVEKASAYVAESHDPGKMAERYLAIYERLRHRDTATDVIAV